MNPEAQGQVALQELPEASIKVHRLGLALRLGSFSTLALVALGVHAFSSGFAPNGFLLLQTLATFLLLALFALWYLFWPPATWKKKAWRLTPSTLEYHHGVLFHHEHFVPRSRVQHTEVSQGPLQRRHDLATLTIYTAGERFADLAISGLEVELARSIRDELLSLSSDHVV